MRRISALACTLAFFAACSSDSGTPAKDGKAGNKDGQVALHDGSVSGHDGTATGLEASIKLGDGKTAAGDLGTMSADVGIIPPADAAGLPDGLKPAKVYGQIDPIPSAEFPFLLDFARVQKQDSAYIALHKNGVVFLPVFTGTVGAEKIPAAPVTMVFGVHSPAMSLGTTTLPPSVHILQNSMQGVGPAGPQVEMTLPNDRIGLGTYTFGSQINLAVIKVLDAAKNDICIMALAIGGTLKVTEATDTTKTDGGKLAFTTATKIDLYYPTDTPFGDISADLAKDGGKVCPK